MMKKQYILRAFCAVLAVCAFMSALSLISVFAQDTTAADTEKTEPEYSAIDLLGTDLSPYIKLGQYEDIDITLNIEVTDEELYKYAVANKVYTEVKSRATRAGDLVNISYVGNVRISNGNLIPVRGGTSTSAVAVTLDSVADSAAKDAKTIAEMLAKSKKLEGVMPGSSVDITLTVPSDYAETAMAGREIIFTVTVASITEYGYTDEYVKSKYGCETVEDYRLLIMKEKIRSFTELLTYDVYLNIVKNATVFKYPEEQYNYYYNAEYSYYKTYYDSNAMYAQTYGSFENFLAALGGSLEVIEQNAKLQTEKDLICAAIYKTGVFGTVSEAEYESRLAELAAENNMTVAQFELMYTGRYDISNIIIVDYTYDSLSKLAKLTTDYNEYTYLLEEETTPSGGEVTTVPGDAVPEPAVDSNVILMIVIIAVGFIGCLVLIILQKKAKVKSDEDDEDDGDGDADEDGEEDEDNEASDGDEE